MKRALLALLLVTACSGASSPHASATPRADPVAAYLAQVNELCDALVAKVQPLSHPGTYPVATYAKELPEHHQLLVDFDAQLAKVVVPPQASSQKAALDAYIAFANDIDRRRAVAAANGQAAFDKEITAENAEFPTDPVAAKRTAAGFASSCDAR